MVSGAAALVWSMHPDWSAAMVQDRLMKTAKPMPGTGLGAGRLDVFEAVFNGSFETGDFSGWHVEVDTMYSGVRTVPFSGVVDRLQNYLPPLPIGRTIVEPIKRNGHGKYMAYVSTGLEPDDGWSSWLKLYVPPIKPDVGSLDLMLDYNYITEEFPEFCTLNPVLDKFVIYVAYPDGTAEIVAESPASCDNILQQISDVHFGLDECHYYYGGSSGEELVGCEDSNAGMTGWPSNPFTHPIDVNKARNGFAIVFWVQAQNDLFKYWTAWDMNIDSVLLIDNIELK
jgi:hypothetical protein